MGYAIGIKDGDKLTSFKAKRERFEENSEW